MTTGPLPQLQIDCALIHLRAAHELIVAEKRDDPRLVTAAHEIQIGIDRLEDRWGS